MIGLDRAQRTVTVAPFIDEDGDRVTPPRACFLTTRSCSPWAA